MRIDLSLTSDELNLLDGFAKANGMSRAKAALHFLRAGLQNPPLTHLENGLHVISVPSGSKRRNITPQQIRDLEDEMEVERALRVSSRAEQR